jgi:hypothetical protein
MQLRAGDLVIVRTPKEIYKTLGPDGTLDGLPFMPEMLEFCGKPFQVFNRVVQSTIDGAFLKHHAESYVREFRNNDVVTLKGIRCSGAEHDKCERGCAIFWKEAWLQKLKDHSQSASSAANCSANDSELRAILKSQTAPGRYFCQSSEFLKATTHLSGIRRIEKCFSAVAAGNISTVGMVKRISIWIWWKIYRRLIGEPARGTLEKTPTSVLNLKPGELVQVKTRLEIIKTLDSQGKNRGLHFSADQLPYCGKQYRVRDRIDNFIAEGTGEMKSFHNSVTLEDALCDSSYFAFGGCYRSDLLYWREIWLQRVELADSAAAHLGTTIETDGHSVHQSDSVDESVRYALPDRTSVQPGIDQCTTVKFNNRN